MESEMCHCFKRARVITSWTFLNPGRRFLTCGNNEHNRCGFFAWFDPPMCERSRTIIPGLLRRINNDEDKVNRYKLREKFWCILLLLSWLIIFALVISFLDEKGN